ncbi:MAG: PQQ-dependent sugar dehydrogenase [Proteobacteria bacterium]|nr:PQQ-dependent sugar dehydrogenase [Pseudomonadota bacterium]
MSRFKYVRDRTMAFAEKFRRMLIVFLIGGLVATCANTDTPTGATVPLQESGGMGEVSSKIWVKTLLRGLKEPWGIDFLPDGSILLTEKGGALKLISPVSFIAREVGGVPDTVEAGQGGLMDVLVHPGFADNGLIYLSYVVAGSQGYSTRVLRARLKNQQLVDHQILFTAQPFYPERRHFGSRLLLDDGYLFITVGDRGNRDLAQSLNTHNGKVMRLLEGGGVPPDNPFVGQKGARPEIWTYGHRNPQGIAKHPVSGDIWVSEHGPQGGDEINRLERGANYGWPVITYGEEYGGGKIGVGVYKQGMKQPLTFYVPSIGTGGIDFYTGDIYPNWKPSLLVAGLRQNEINRVALEGNGLGKKTRLLTGMRIRDVQVGPDGLVYALADGSRLVRLQLQH